MRQAIVESTLPCEKKRRKKKKRGNKVDTGINCEPADVSLSQTACMLKESFGSHTVDSEKKMEEEADRCNAAEKCSNLKILDAESAVFKGQREMQQAAVETTLPRRRKRKKKKKRENVIDGGINCDPGDVSLCQTACMPKESSGSHVVDLQKKMDEEVDRCNAAERCLNGKSLDAECAVLNEKAELQEAIVETTSRRRRRKKQNRKNKVDYGPNCDPRNASLCQTTCTPKESSGNHVIDSHKKVDEEVLPCATRVNFSLEKKLGLDYDCALDCIGDSTYGDSDWTERLGGRERGSPWQSPVDMWTRRPWRRKHRRNQSPRLLPRKRYRSRSPYRLKEADFGSERLRQSRAQIPECNDFHRDRCFLGRRCPYLHHGLYGSRYSLSKERNFGSPPRRRYFCSNVEGKVDTTRSSVEHDKVKSKYMPPSWDWYAGSKFASEDAITDGITKAESLKDVKHLVALVQDGKVASNMDECELYREPNSRLFNADAAHTSRPSESIDKVALEDHSLNDATVPDLSNKHLEDANGVATSKMDGLSRSSMSVACQEDRTSDDSSFVRQSCIDADLPLVSTHYDTLFSSNKEEQSKIISEFSLGPTVSDPAVQRSKRKLLILDLNGLLADITPNGRLRRKPDANISKKRAVFKRPFCDDFVKFCLERFDLGVWSSRTRENVDAVVNFLMPYAKKHLRFCWDQSHCTKTGYQTLENYHKPLVLKELKKLWDRLEPDLPWEKGEYDESNTLLLDDSPYKAVRNPPYTAIFPLTYSYMNVKDMSLGPGGDIRVYLERLAAAENVQQFVKENPFGQRPITPTSSSWPFYLKVIEGKPSKQRK